MKRFILKLIVLFAFIGSCSIASAVCAVRFGGGGLLISLVVMGILGTHLVLPFLEASND